MPQFFEVTLNGVPLKRGLSQAEAEAMAERWQGERYRRGLLKHGDKRDYVEVRRDAATERDWDERYDQMKRNNPQTIHLIGDL